MNGKNLSAFRWTAHCLWFCASTAFAADLEWAGWAKNTADNGLLAPSQDLIVVVDSKPLGAATNARVHFAVDGGAKQSRGLEHHGFANYDVHDRWTANLGKFPEGATVSYRMEVAGPNQAFQFQDQATIRNAAAPIRWIGHLQTEPAPGELNPGNELRVFSDMQPPGVAVAAEVGLSTNDGSAWQTVPMARGGSADGRETWSANLGAFPAGAALRLYVRAQNGAGDSFWDSNGGADYRLRVNSPIRDVYPDKGRYAPGDTARFQIDLYPFGPETNAFLSVRFKHLEKDLHRILRRVSGGPEDTNAFVFPWKTPTNDFRGYGVDVDLIVDGKIRDSRSTAIDVSSDWTRFPRMGFFSEYPEGADADALAAGLAKFHLNAIQFYDWKWTHDRLVPYDDDGQPLNVFTQVGGRVQSFQTVKDKIAAVQARGMAALSYTLMYGDSGNGEPEHAEWAAFMVPNSTNLFDIRQHDAGSYKIWVMDVSNPDWKKHIFGQFADALDRAGFDGIHLDNLGGAWCYKYNSDVGIPERGEFPKFIREARTFLRRVHPRAIVTHNDVMGNYLPEIARSDADVYYSEVWSRPTYRDLRDNVREVRAAAPNKAAVFAAYVNRKPWDDMGDPALPPLPTFINDASARLLDAALFANGAFHIEMGDDGQMLVNEYFPARAPRMHAGLRRAMRDLYDFAVRYEEFLFADLRDVSAAGRVSSATHALSPDAESGAIWTVTRECADGALALNLINRVGVDDPWRKPCANPAPQQNVALKIRADRKIRRAFLATPDDGFGRPQPLPFQAGADANGEFVELAVPRLAFWNLVVLDPAHPAPEDLQ
ncbi:MAG: glycoside hydrolase family 66 protein [Kiritimatiellia bacterium]